MVPSPHIVAVLGVPLLFVLAFWLGRITAPRKRTRGLYLRPSFWLRPVASPTPNHGTIREPSEQEITAFISSHYPPGSLSAAWAIPRVLHDESRITGRGWSGTPAPGSPTTALARGALGAQRKGAA